jgi:hypothetical protein
VIAIDPSKTDHTTLNGNFGKFRYSPARSAQAANLVMDAGAAG